MNRPLSTPAKHHVPKAGDPREGISTPRVAQAGGTRVRVMTGLTTFAGRAWLAGPALTCACCPEDNLAVHLALYRAAAGTVIVCHGGGTSGCGLLGELMATDAVNRGLGGLVVQGPVRDIDDIDRLGFPVLCTGTAPGRAAKAAAVSVGQPVVVGSVLVESGDQIVADRDGAVVVPAADWPAVRAGAAELATREDRIRARLAAGDRLADIIGLNLGG